MNEDEALKKRKKEINQINDKYRNIKAKIQEFFPKIDIDFFEKIQYYEYLREDEYNLIDKYFNINFDELSYSKFIAYKFNSKMKKRFINFDKIDEKDKEHLQIEYIIEDYDLFLDSLNKINPNIFMSNVNLDWKILQLAKNDKSIKIPPNAPPLPSPPKRSSPKKSKSKLTKEGLEDAKSKLKPKGPPYPPHLPETKLRVRKPLQSPRKSSSKSKLTKEELEIAKSKLKPKGPPYPPVKKILDPKNPDFELENSFPPPLPSPPKRSSPKKSKLTKEELEIAKSKLKHSQKNLKPDDPNYYLEMAFRNLEK